VTPEQDQQLFLDGLQPTDIQRIIGHNQERADRTIIEQTAEFLGGLISSYHRVYREDIKLVSVRGVDDKGLPYTEVHIR
jgi:hypothetical protein